MANAASDIPLTVMPGQETFISNQASAWSEIIIGEGQNKQILQLGWQPSNVYWFVCVDRRTLKVVVNVNQSENDVVPQQVSSLANGPDAFNYLLLLLTNGLRTDNVPQGNLYSFLMANGAGTMLKRIEQINNTLGCGSWGSVTYALVDILGDEAPGFETMVKGTADDGLMTLKLVPVDINGETFYTPATLT